MYAYVSECVCVCVCMCVARVLVVRVGDVVRRSDACERGVGERVVYGNGKSVAAEQFDDVLQGPRATPRTTNIDSRTVLLCPEADAPPPWPCRHARPDGQPLDAYNVRLQAFNGIKLQGKSMTVTATFVVSVVRFVCFNSDIDDMHAFCLYSPLFTSLRFKVSSGTLCAIRRWQYNI